MINILVANGGDEATAPHFCDALFCKAFAHSLVRTNPGDCRSLSMAEPKSSTDRTCARLQQQIALSTLVDDLVVASLAAKVAAFREAGVSDVEEFERVIRSHRLAVLKQGAILGAVGLDE